LAPLFFEKLKGGKKMKIFFYFLKNMGYSGNNTCIVSRTSNGVVRCRCINIRAECDMSQAGGDMYGLACPLFYEPEKGLIEILKNLKKEEKCRKN
jgi:hypothetical protein